MFLASVFLLLFTAALFFPKDGIRISDGIKINFFTRDDILNAGKVRYADIDNLLSRQEMLNDSILLAIAEGRMIRKIDADSLRSSITPIEYPNNDSTLLYSFFRTLKNLPQSGQLIRIMHYGDSQIEDDRITSLLRNRLQSRFGGSGAGLVPAAQLYPYAFSMKQENSENWERYIGFARRDTSLGHTRYGPLASFCTFTPANLPGLRSDSTEAWIRFGVSPYAYNNTKTFTQCRIFYGWNRSPFLNELYIDATLADADIFPASSQLRVIRYTFDNPGKEIMLKFKGSESPEIYGIALDGKRGVAVDNIPLRGCSGLFFTAFDEELMSAMYKELNVKLFILQFGGNFVPSGLDNYTGYENWFYSQLIRIKKLCPSAKILVIGVADMSVKERNYYVTNPNVEKVRNALRSASFRAGAAFWDMYRAMGGRNSMPSWVNADPPLASDDFVHFNPRGAKTIAQMFYNSFILEYHRYENYAK